MLRGKRRLTSSCSTADFLTAMASLSSRAGVGSKWFGDDSSAQCSRATTSDAVLSYRLDVRVPPLAKPEDLAAFAARQRPTLVLGADDDVSFPGRALIARVKELIPHAEVALLDGCKHCPPFDDAFRSTTASRVQAFLEAARVGA